MLPNALLRLPLQLIFYLSINSLIQTRLYPLRVSIFQLPAVFFLALCPLGSCHLTVGGVKSKVSGLSLSLSWLENPLYDNQCVVA